MDLFNLFAKISLDTSEYEKGLDDSENKAEGFGSKLKKGLATAAKISASAVGAAATGISAIVKSAVSSYADYEQLVGGVETLFKDSADIVQAYAANAYKTAGLSANDYMETVTSFSASLLQSLGGDTQAAAKYADMAITDMSDNANKMGSDMSSIQSAYQGFAKQNYTMLDNLKLGYGGTKTEMERLIFDAEKLDSTFKATRDENGALTMSYADVVDAIHIVQTEMDITGTTAKEASTTISGSIGSMKSAWQNLLVGLAAGNADINSLIDNVVNSAETAFGNLLPVIERALTSIGSLVQRIAPIIVEKLPGVVSKVLPSLLSAATELINGVVAALPILMSVLADQAPMIVETLVTGIVRQLPEIVKTGLVIILTLADSLSSSLPDLIPVAMQAIITITETLLKPENIGKLLKAAVELIGALGKGILGALTEVLKWSSSIVQKLTEGIRKKFADIKATGKAAITNVIDGVKSTFSNLVSAGGNVIENIKSGVSGAFTRFREWIGEKFASIKEKITAPFDTARETIRGIIDRIKDLFDFEWKLPKLKMPHFSWKWEKVGDILKLPKISVDWYAKAYDNPMMFTSPTVMATADGLKGFGDRPGGEIVYGKSQLINDIKTAFSDVIGTNRPILLYLDGKTLVGGTSKQMDKKLGDIQTYQLRWEGAK